MTGRENAGDVIGLAEFGLVLAGVGQVWPPVALIVAGVLALLIGWQMTGGPGAHHA
jgi:hypothetical protein